MTWDLQYYIEVGNDILLAKQWYRKQQEGLQLRFSKEVYQTIENIQKDPLIYQVRYKDVRVAYLKIFPFGIHYFINESRHTITVIAVMHQHINPQTYYNR